MILFCMFLVVAIGIGGVIYIYLYDKRDEKRTERVVYQFKKEDAMSIDTDYLEALQELEIEFPGLAYLKGR